MSSFFRLPIRERWSSRSMVVRQWLVSSYFSANEPLCELEVDGQVRVVRGPSDRFGPNERGMIYHFFVAEGQEVGPFGELFEFIDRDEPVPELPPAGLHSNAKLKLVRRERYPKIFLNYRRDDADAYAGRLHEVLSQEFGGDEVFMAEFSIRGGEVWDWTIQQAVVHARVTLALVGKQWLTVSSGETRRIESPHDLVRREIVGSMDRGTRVIPVLLPEAALPRTGDFGWDDELRPLLQVQFHRMTGARHWKTDVGDLVNTIREHLESES